MDEEDELFDVDAQAKVLRARVHFDRFGKNWDQEYTIGDFTSGKVSERALMKT